MIRKIIKINQELCNGCGICAQACHEGAIGMKNGKAILLRDDYCDGLGDCLPQCPTSAISFEEREALAYNEAEVKNNMAKKTLACGCPGTNSKMIMHKIEMAPKPEHNNYYNVSELNQWPVQIKLVPTTAPYFNHANLLVAADCTAYAYADFHQKFMKNKITLIGCPKLDECDYSQKLCEIISNNEIKSITIVRMEVPCCSGIENAVKQALIASGKLLPWSVFTVTTEGELLD